MAPRDHDGTDGSARLIVAQDQVYLATGGRLVLVDAPDRLAALIDKVLLVAAPAGRAAQVPVEAVRSLARAGDRLRIETVGHRSGEPITITAPEATIMVTLMSGHYRDRWTAEAFALEIVNTAPDECEVMLDLYLPLLDDDGGDAKQMTAQTDDGSQEFEVHRGGPTPVQIPVKTVLNAEFWTAPEPYQGSDARSRGVLVASIRGSAGQVADVFHLSSYFD
jgi:hypothetical protein